MSRRSRLRILAFCDYFSSTPSGGAERVALEVYPRLAHEGAQVVLVTTAPSGSIEPYEMGGIHVHPVRALDLSGVTGSQFSLAPGAITEALRLSKHFRPDVLHANSLHFQTSIACAVLHHRYRRPMVMTVHSAHSENLPGTLRDLTRMYERTVGRFLLRSSREVIAVSRGGKDHLRDLGVPTARITVVPNGVDHNRFRPPVGVTTPSTKPLILFVGRLVANKGAEVLLDATRMLRGREDIQVALVGEGPLRDRLERSIRSTRLAETVRFVGHSDDVPGWLGRAAVLVQPSFAEGLSLLILEAMASGVCVVASDVGGNRELLIDGESGLLFRAGDRHALSGILERVLGDEDLRRGIGSAAHEESKRYTWEICASATAEVLARAATADR